MNKATNKKHARNSPSSAYRWMACPGSIALAEKCPKQKTNVLAAEGTAAHLLAEHALINMYHEGESLRLEDRIGEKIKVEDFEFEVTPEMVDAVALYVSAVNELAPISDRPEACTHVKIEETFSLDWLHKDVSGTNDCCIYDEEKQEISVLDLKYGKGLIVAPKWNPQLMIYALGALHTFTTKSNAYPREIKNINLYVVQPRAFHVDGMIRSWSITPKELLFWSAQVLKPAILETHNPNAKLYSGKHCRFCPAIAICPEQAQTALEAAKTDFDRPTLPHPETMTTQELEKVMEVSERISSWAKAVEAYVVHNMKSGSLTLPNYKLVQKKTIRKWKNEDYAAQELELVFGNCIFKKKLTTPAQIEKLAKKCKLKMSIENLTMKPEGELTVAPNSDPRPSKNNNTISDFIDSASFLQ